jgi:outer membrane protein W
MRQSLLLAVLFVFTINSFSQNSKFSIEANYPILIDNNFIGEDAYGIIDVGLKYRFIELNPVKIGISINGGVLVDNSNQNKSPQDYLITTYIIQPKMFAEFDIESIEKLHPFLGIGYTFLNFQLSGSNKGIDVSGESDNLSGFGLNFGIIYDLTNKMFIHAQYDFTKLNVDDVPDIKFNTNVNLLKVGIGFRI